VPLIELKNIQKVFRNDDVETPAVRDISFTIEKGEIVAIMGPSGSGKSTLLHILGFLDVPSGGEYYFRNKLITDYSPTEQARVRNKEMGFVFQSFNLLPRTSILENVKLPLLYSDVKESRWNELARQAITTVGLTHRIQHVPSQLSGGEKQRVAIARALVNAPAVIFADEPTGNLDSASGKMVMETLQNLNEKFGHTIVVITHETYTAEHAGRIIRIHDGRVVGDQRVEKRLRASEQFRK